MRIVETLIIMFILLNSLYILFYYYQNYVDFEIRREEHLRIKLILLEASQRYIEYKSYIVDKPEEFEYLGRTIIVDISPKGENCIYRYMNFSGKISKTFFCTK